MFSKDQGGSDWCFQDLCHRCLGSSWQSGEETDMQTIARRVLKEQEHSFAVSTEASPGDRGWLSNMGDLGWLSRITFHRNSAETLVRTIQAFDVTLREKYLGDTKVGTPLSLEPDGPGKKS